MENKPFPFAMWPLQKTESGLSPEEHARLMARFPSTPRISSPARISSAPSDTPSDDEGIAAWEVAHNAPFHGPGSVGYRQAGPDTRFMRNVAVRAPTGVQPIVSIKDMDESMLPGAIYRNQDQNHEYKELARQHIEHTGSLNNGDIFLRLGLLHKNIADQIADEYLKWHDQGGGPIPDLSKYENPVTRNKDGTPWDWRKTAQEAYELHKDARTHDFYHHGIYAWLHDPLQEVSEINPRKIWQQIHMLVTKKWDPTSREINPIQSQAINLNTLRTEGLHANQYPNIVKALMRLGNHHVRMHALTKANPFPFAIWPVEKSQNRRTFYGLAAQKMYRKYPEADMEPGKMYGIFYPTGFDRKPHAIELDSPEKLAEFEAHPKKAQIVGFFGKTGLLEFRGSMQRKYHAISVAPATPGLRAGLVTREIREPDKNLHIAGLAGGSDFSGNFGDERIDNPEVQRKLFDALHRAGIKTITSSPISESRSKLFARITDKFHNESGGLV